VKGYIVLLGGVCLLLLAGGLAPAVSAETSTNNSKPSYEVVQGDEVFSVEPLEGDEPLEEFYEYRHPEVGDRDDPFWGRSFSSEGTVEYQQDDTSILMLYDGPEGVSLVAVHDRYHENQDAGTTGGSVSWEVSGLPEDGEWAVIDDDYGWVSEHKEQDDIFYLDEDHQTGAAGNDGEPPSDVDAMLSWVWLTGRTDGMAFRGIGSEPSITIDPAFNNESYHRYGDQRRTDEPPDRPGMGERYNGSIDEWQLIVPTDDGEYDRISLPSLEEPIEIRSAENETADETANETKDERPEIAVESVTLNDSTTEPGEQTRVTAVVENSGDVEGNKTVSLSVGGTELQTETVRVAANETQTVEFTQSFAATGVYELSVGDQQMSLLVESADDDRDTPTNESATQTEDNVPGFGFTSPLGGLFVAIVAMRLLQHYSQRLLGTDS